MFSAFIIFDERRKTMPKKFVCYIHTKKLQEIYSREGMTLEKMCPLVGCESAKELADLFRRRGIAIDRNKNLSYKKRGNRTDEEFEKYLEKEYTQNKRSIASIAKEMGVQNSVISRYLDKYKIKKRSRSEQLSGKNSGTWKGGKRITSSGYIERRVFNHPNANSRGCKYEHQMVAELKLGRYLKKGEVAHHIDLNKANNDFDNIVVLSSSDHTKVHAKIRKGIDPREALKGVNIIIC